MSEYRFEARDMRTGILLGDLPLGQVTLTQQLQGHGLHGTIRGVLNLTERSMPRRQVIPAQPGFVTFPGDNGNVLLVPYQPEWQLDGDVTLLIEVRVPTWGSGNVDVLLAQRGVSATVAWWDLRITAGGSLQIQMNEGLGGSNLSVTLGSAAEMTAVPVGEWVTLAVVVRPNVAGSRRVRAYWSTDGMQTWTPISGVKGGTAFSIPSTEQLSIAAHGQANNGLVGDTRLVAVRRGSNGDLPGGTEVFRLAGSDYTDPAAATIQASTGQTVTVQRGGTPLTITPYTPPANGPTLPGQRLAAGFLNGTRTGRTIIWVYRDGQVWDGFIVWSRPKRIGVDSIEVNGANLLSYFGKRIIATSVGFSGWDQLRLARYLIDLANPSEHIYGFDNSTTNNSGVLRDARPLVNWFERKTIGQTLSDAADNINGYEYSIDVALVNDLPVPTFRAWYPRRGRTYNQTGFLLLRSGDKSGNILAYGLVDDATDLVTAVHAIGAGEGQDMLIRTVYNTDLLDRGWPLIEKTISYKDVSRVGTLQGHARAELERAAKAAFEGPWEVRVDPDDRSVRFGSWVVGDEARVVIEDDDRFPAGPNGEPGLDRVMRIVGHTVTVSNDGGPENVTLQLEPL